MFKLDEHKGLHGSGHRGVIPYVHERCIVVCVAALFKVELNLSASVIRLAFYNSRPGSYTVT
jgi:hypothetical protein